MKVSVCAAMCISFLMVSPMVPCVAQNTGKVKLQNDDPQTIEEVRKELDRVTKQLAKDGRGAGNAQGEREIMEQYRREMKGQTSPKRVEQDRPEHTGGSWSTWQKGDLLGLDKNLPVTGSTDVELFVIPLAIKNAAGPFKKRTSRTAY